MAISTRGVVHSKVRMGAFDREAFQEFITELSLLMMTDKVAFVMDNCRIHYSVTFDNANHVIVYLPPYSPFLNSIEGVFSGLKAGFKMNISNLPCRENLTMPERRDALMNAIYQEIGNVQVDVINSHYRHCTKFYSNCLQKLEIIGD